MQNMRSIFQGSIVVDLDAETVTLEVTSEFARMPSG